MIFPGQFDATFPMTLASPFLCCELVPGGQGHSCAFHASALEKEDQNICGQTLEVISLPSWLSQQQQLLLPDSKFSTWYHILTFPSNFLSCEPPKLWVCWVCCAHSELPLTQSACLTELTCAHFWVHTAVESADRWFGKDKTERLGHECTSIFLCVASSLTTVAPWDRVGTNPWPPQVTSVQ